MRTAMQELIEELNTMYNNDYAGAKEGLRIAIDTAMNQFKSIEKEKEQLISFYEQGYSDCNANLLCLPKNHYNETFKPEQLK
jgi:hypothetical protein